MSVDLEMLAQFIVTAKKAAYATDGAVVQSQRIGFKELEFIEGDWNYRDSYAGFYFAPGQEVEQLRLKATFFVSKIKTILVDSF